MKGLTFSCTALAMLLLPFGCKREQRVFDPGSAGTQVADGTALNEVHAGGSAPVAGHHEV